MYVGYVLNQNLSNRLCIEQYRSTEKYGAVQYCDQSSKTGKAGINMIA